MNYSIAIMLKYCTIKQIARVTDILVLELFIEEFAIIWSGPTFCVNIFLRTMTW